MPPMTKDQIKSVILNLASAAPVGAATIGTRLATISGSSRKRALKELIADGVLSHNNGIYTLRPAPVAPPTPPATVVQGAAPIVNGKGQVAGWVVDPPAAPKPKAKRKRKVQPPGTIIDPTTGELLDIVSGEPLDPDTGEPISGEPDNDVDVESTKKKKVKTVVKTATKMAPKKAAKKTAGKPAKKILKGTVMAKIDGVDVELTGAEYLDEEEQARTPKGSLKGNGLRTSETGVSGFVADALQGKAPNRAKILAKGESYGPKAKWAIVNYLAKAKKGKGELKGCPLMIEDEDGNFTVAKGGKRAPKAKAKKAKTEAGGKSEEE